MKEARFTHMQGSQTILIVNVHSMMNAGDAALLVMNMRQLAAGFSNPHFIVSANYPEEPFLHQLNNTEVVPSAYAILRTNRGVPVPLQIIGLLGGALLAILLRMAPASWTRKIQPTAWLSLIQAYRKANIVVAVSGNQFLSMGRYGWPYPLMAFSVWLAHLYRKPFYVMPQSIGPLKRDWEKRLLKALYGRARKVFLRDEVSLALSKEIGLPEERIHFAPDPAFALETASTESIEKVLSRYGYQAGSPSIGLTVIAPIARALNEQMIQKYYRDLAAALEKLITTTGARIFIFNQVTGPTEREDDRTAGRLLISLLGKSSSQVVLVDEVLPPQQLKAGYACMDLMIASRLHSGIFAMGAGVPTVLIGYFTKSRGLLQAMGLEAWLIELGQAGADAMINTFQKAWDQRRELGELTHDKAAQYAAESLLLGHKICEDYERA